MTNNTIDCEDKSQSSIFQKFTQDYWIENIYQGDNTPQLTFRAVIMGGVLGSLMSISNLYTTIKVGWSFGVAITSCVLSYVIWNTILKFLPKLGKMGILENNCMQSTASAAGYSTGSTIATAFGALLLISGNQIDPMAMMAWTFVTACLGVFLAVPMKRQMINQEQLTFPSGVAAAQTLKSLYAQSLESIKQARSLVGALVVGVLVGFLKGHPFQWLYKLPDLLAFSMRLNKFELGLFPGFGFEPSVLLLGAGMIMSLRVCVSLFLSACVLYFVVGPLIVHIPHDYNLTLMGHTYLLNWHQDLKPSKLISGWALWTGASILVSSGLTSFVMQGKIIFESLKFGSKKVDFVNQDKFSKIEVPNNWLIIGLIPLIIVMTTLEYFIFKISIVLGFVSILLSAILAMIACRATGETDVTPIGAMGKITQLFYSIVSPSNITANLMTASVTANIASSSADLLTDLKSGYLLGANPRKQFLAQFIGVFFGTIAVVPAWYAMIPNKEKLLSYNPPATLTWMAVAEALAHGIDFIPYSARIGIALGLIIGFVFTILEARIDKKYLKFVPSPMGLGLAWIMPFSNSLAFLLGALISYFCSKLNNKTAELYVVPIASGLVAGESIVSAVIAIISSAGSFIGKS